MSLPSTKIIAHRGSSYEAPENTMSSAKIAIDQNADALEVDIHLTKDNEIVVIHDADIKRTAGIKKNVKDLSLNELKQYEFGSWKAKKWNGERIPTLKEILQILPPEKTIFIEIKSGAECLPELKKLFFELNIPTSQIVLMDFNFETVKKAKSMFPDVEVLFLYEFKRFTTSANKRNQLDDIIKMAGDYKIDGLNIQNVKQLDADFIKKAKDNGLKCYCWTVDNHKRAKYLIDSGIDGIATNRPGWIKLKLKME
jgi:glycerophosphoryl diester phosphodiesterase